MSKKKEKVVTVIEKDGLDEFMFENIRDARKVAELTQKGVAEEGLVQDSFTSFYTQDPRLEQAAPLVQKGVLKTLLDLQEFQNLHEDTSGDEVSSALGSVQFSPKLIEQYYEIKKKIEEKKQQAQKAGQQDPTAPGKDGTEPTLEDLLGDKEMGAVRQGLRRAVEEAQDKVDEWNDLCMSWGVDKGELKQVPFEQKLELADQLLKQKNLKKISDLMGRFKNIVNASPSLAPLHGMDEIVDIGLSDKIDRILPSEALKLMEMPELFYSDMLEGKLLTYNLKNVEDLGKGPIIACLDISGSMEGAREEWAKAVVLSLMHLAEKQNRAFGFIAFESCVQAAKFWPARQPSSLQEKIEVASTATTGGTNFWEPLKYAFEMRSKEPALKPADIVFITDGECALHEEQLKEIKKQKENTEVRIYGIAINDGSGGSAGGTLEGFCDQIAIVNSLGDISTIKDLVTATASGQAAGTVKKKP